MHSQNDEKFMQVAIEHAKKAKEIGDLPFGAVIVCDGKVVGVGKAENGTIGDVTDHAEMLALRTACKSLGRNELKDCTIYCTNEPCNMCAAAIFQAKIANVRMGLSRDDLPNLLRPRNLGITHLAEDSGYDINIIRGICKEEILQLFKGIVKK